MQPPSVQVHPSTTLEPLFVPSANLPVKMYDPETFEKFSGTKIATEMALDKYGHLIKWNLNNMDTILDVGCGPANVLVEAVLPRCHGKYSKFFGTDLSEKMIDFAAQKYATMDNVEFLTMDITDVKEFLYTHGQMDHVVSSFLLHWVPDQNKALKNIFKLLKPGGDFFTVHARDSVVFNIYEYMDHNEKWNKYFDNLSSMIPRSQKSKQPEEDLREQMTKAGFTDVFVTTIPHKMDFKNDAYLKEVLGSAAAQVTNIPEEQRKEYMNDFFDYGAQKGIIAVNESGKLSIKLNMFVAFGRKPQ